MTAHRRTQMRQAFVAQLRNATVAEERVYSGRLMPIQEQLLPAIVIHTREPEQVIDRSTSGYNGFERRRCIVSIICVAQSFGSGDDENDDEDDIDTILDAMAQEVEAALQPWTIPGFESADAILLDTRTDDPEFDGSLTTGATILRYEVLYTTPYRDCSDPYVLGSGPLERSGAYPGGQVTPGCPADNIGTACPIGGATIITNGTPDPTP
jgi:hypothetical protein